MLSKIKKTAYSLLRWSEKYTKTDMVYLAQGGFWLTLGQGVAAFSSFILSIVFANVLAKETFGLYKYILSIAGLLAIATLSGMGPALVQAIARGYERSFLPVIKTRIRWGLLGSLLSLGLAGYYQLHSNTTLATAFLITAVFTPFMDSFWSYDSILNGKKLFALSSQYAIVSQLLAALAMILALLWSKNILVLLGVYFSSWTLLRFYFLKITLTRIKLNNKIDLQSVNYGKHLSAMNIITTIATYFDKLLIFHFLGAADLALYSIAIAPPEQLKKLLTIIHQLTFPKFVRRSHKNLKKVIQSKISRLFLVSFVLVLVYLFFCPWLFKIFFPKYQAGIFYSQLFSISLLNLTLSPAATALQAKKMVKEQYISNFFSSIFQIIIMSILIIFYGLLGLIVARIINRFLGVIFNYYLYYRTTGGTSRATT